MIEFKKVSFKNFMSIGEADVNLDTEGFTLVSGVNNRIEDLTQSNGSGKSTLSEGIIWALTGETIRGHKEVLNKYSGGDCEVSVSFNFKGHSWVIRRGIFRPKEKFLEIYKDGELIPSKGYRDSQEVFEKELPEITYKFMNSVVILGQGLPGRFTNNTPSGRKAVLEELTNADFMINQVKEAIKRRQEELNGKLREAQDTKLSKETGKDYLLRSIQNDTQSLEKEKALDTSLLEKEIAESKERGINEKKFNDDLQKKISELEQELKAIGKEESEMVEGYSQRISKIKDDLHSEERKERDLLSEKKLGELNDLNSEEFSLKEAISGAKEKLAHSEAIVSGGFCRLCGQRLPSSSEEEIEKAKIGISKFGAEILSLEKKLLENQGKIKEINTKYSDLDNDIAKRYSIMVSEKTSPLTDEMNIKKAELGEKLNTAMETLGCLRVSLKRSTDSLVKMREEYRGLVEALKNKADTIQKLEQAIEANRGKLVSIEGDIEKAQKTIDDLQARIKVVKSMETFASRDFRGILLEEVISRLDTILKGYSEIVYGNSLTHFYQDGNAIVVEFDGKEYESLSGGEQQKLNVILQLSLRDLIIELTGLSGSFLFLDEIFDGLDHTGCDKMIELVQSLGTNVFVISHHEDLSIPYDQQIVVVKEANGISHVEYT